MDLLSEVGYERLTTAQTAQRAGVSKGAQAHHFPSKDDLLVAAFQHLLSQWETRRAAFAHRRRVKAAAAADGVAPDAPMPPLLRYLWRDVFGRRDYLASLELMLAARHHPALRERLQRALSAWTTSRDDIFRQLVPLDDPARLHAFMQASFCLLRGLAVYEGLAEGRAVREQVLDLWAEMADAYLREHLRPQRAPAGSSALRPARSRPARRSTKRPASPGHSPAAEGISR